MIHREQEAKAVLILITFLMSVVFIAFESERKIKPFPLYQKWEDRRVVPHEREIKVENYIYYLNEYLILVVAFHIIKTEARKFRLFYSCVFYALVFDVADYLLTFNTEWFYIGKIPMSANILIFIFVGAFFIYDVWKDRQ